MVIRIKRLHGSAKLPERAHEGDVGFDLFAATAQESPVSVTCGCGWAFEFPKGVYALLYARSSIWKTGLSLCNSVGVIDTGYRGEVVANFYKLGPGARCYMLGDKFAQLVFQGIAPENVQFEEVQELATTDRGEGGFGSTGQ